MGTSVDHLRMALVFTAVDAVALALAVTVILELTRRQEERAAALLPTARVA